MLPILGSILNEPILKDRVLFTRRDDDRILGPDHGQGHVWQRDVLPRRVLRAVVGVDGHLLPHRDADLR